MNPRKDGAQQKRDEREVGFRYHVRGQVQATARAAVSLPGKEHLKMLISEGGKTKERAWPKARKPREDLFCPT